MSTNTPWRIYIAPTSYGQPWGSSSSGLRSTRGLKGDLGVVTLVLEPGAGEYYECTGFKPELPAALAQTPVVKVSFIGAPPKQDITPALYEIDGASASVTRNGEKLKVELTAPTCESAWSLWRAMLVSRPDAIVTTY